MASTTGTKKWWMVGTAAGVVVAVGLLFGARTCSRYNKEYDAMQEDLNNKIENVGCMLDTVGEKVAQKQRVYTDSIEVLNNRIKELENCCAKKAAKKPSKPAGGNRVVREEVPSAAGNPDCGCQGVAMNGSSNDGTIIVSGASNNADTNSDCGGGTVALNNGSVNNGVIVVGDCGAANEEPQKKYSEIRFKTKFYGTTR